MVCLAVIDSNAGTCKLLMLIGASGSVGFSTLATALKSTLTLTPSASIIRTSWCTPAVAG